MAGRPTGHTVPESPSPSECPAPRGATSGPHGVRVRGLSPYFGPRLHRVHARHLSRIGGRTGRIGLLDERARRLGDIPPVLGTAFPSARVAPVAGVRHAQGARSALARVRVPAPRPGSRVKIGIVIRSRVPFACTGRPRRAPAIRRTAVISVRIRVCRANSPASRSRLGARIPTSIGTSEREIRRACLH